MLILAVDCSATPASVALLNDDKITGEFFINTKLTHSQTLIPMIDSLLKCTCTDIKDVDVFAINSGPGSFTGVRIAVAAIKGISMPFNKPCVSVSTLESMSYNAIETDCLICAVMDARCNQVYNALFRCSDGQSQRICSDRALSINDLTQELKSCKEKIVLVGDGAKLCYDVMSKELENVSLSSEQQRYQRASSVAILAKNKYNNGEFMTPGELMPTYLRLPQAQRELNKKQNKE